MKYKILGLICVFLIVAGAAGAAGAAEKAEKNTTIEKYFLRTDTLNALITQVEKKFTTFSVADLYSAPTMDLYSTDPYSTGAEKIRAYVKDDSIFNQITSETYDKRSFLNILENDTMELPMILVDSNSEFIFGSISTFAAIL